MSAPAGIGVYIHIPYCRTLCPYCDFVRERLSGGVPDGFLAALEAEIVKYDGPACVKSVFFGGGTPSLLSPEQLARVMECIRGTFQLLPSAEVTLEANPDDVTTELVAAWKSLGVNRVSLGVQSFDDAVLRYLGRRHDADRARRACDLVASGFENWSLDLIFGAPPTSTWRATLEECLSRRPTHISTYGLTYEQGTAFEARAVQAIEDDESLEMYRLAHDLLAESGPYGHYEISNFALPGRECVHNLVYWHNEEYAGFGPGAYSFCHGLRSCNQSDVAAYLHSPLEKAESIQLSVLETKVETCIQYLRLAEGLPVAAYRERFGSDVMTDFGPMLDELARRGLIVDEGEAIRPTQTGFELNNEIGIALVA